MTDITTKKSFRIDLNPKTLFLFPVILSRHKHHPIAPCQRDRDMADFHQRADLIRHCDDPCLFVSRKRSKRKHMRQDRVPLTFADLKNFLAVFRRNLRMIKRLMFSGRRLLMKVIQAEIMQKPGTRGNTGVCAKQIRHPPGQIGHIQAVHQPVRPEMMCIAAKLLKLRILQDRKNVRHICGGNLFRHFNLHRQSLTFFMFYLHYRQNRLQIQGISCEFFLNSFLLYITFTSRSAVYRPDISLHYQNQ